MTEEQCVNVEEPQSVPRSPSFFSLHCGAEPSLNSAGRETANNKDPGSGEAALEFRAALHAENQHLTADDEAGEDDVPDAAELKVDPSAERIQWSAGANRHFGLECRPCAWNWRPSGCQNGSACIFCHICPKEALRERRRQTERRRKEERQALRVACSTAKWQNNFSLKPGLQSRNAQPQEHANIWSSALQWQPSCVNQETSCAMDIIVDWPVQAQQQYLAGYM